MKNIKDFQQFNEEFNFFNKKPIKKVEEFTDSMNEESEKLIQAFFKKIKNIRATESGEHIFFIGEDDSHTGYKLSVFDGKDVSLSSHYGEDFDQIIKNERLTKEMYDFLIHKFEPLIIKERVTNS